LTGEQTTFHFVLGTDRYKDNRIPPKGFRIGEAAARHSVPVWERTAAPNFFTAPEYEGGYDAVELALPTSMARVEVNLYYQTTSREYIEFLRDEIRGSGNLTLDNANYIAQSDPFFTRLRAWGDTIWNLWVHNRNAPGAAPVLMAQASVGSSGGGGGGGGGTTCDTPTTPAGLTAQSGGNRSVPLSWGAVTVSLTGYNVYYDQAGKTQFVATVPAGTTSYTDRQLKQKTQYCYVVTAVNVCGDVTVESAPSTPPACATTK
jgi:hypothetical protein